MDKYEYDCDYCGKKYIPRRRHAQRFCSTSCRVGSHNRKKKLSKPFEIQELPVGQEQKEKEKIRLTGIAEAAIANLATDGLKALLTKAEDKLVTQGDLNAVKQQIIQQIKAESLYTRLSQQPKKDDNDFGSGWV